MKDGRGWGCPFPRPLGCGELRGRGYCRKPLKCWTPPHPPPRAPLPGTPVCSKAIATVHPLAPPERGLQQWLPHWSSGLCFLFAPFHQGAPAWLFCWTIAVFTSLSCLVVPGVGAGATPCGVRCRLCPLLVSWLQQSDVTSGSLLLLLTCKAENARVRVSCDVSYTRGQNHGLLWRHKLGCQSPKNTVYRAHTHRKSLGMLRPLQQERPTERKWWKEKQSSVLISYSSRAPAHGGKYQGITDTV